MNKPRTRAIALAVIASALLGAAAIAQADIAQKGHIRVSFQGDLTPKALPRSAQAPVKVSVGAKISSTSAKVPTAQLHTMTIAINRYGVLNTKGLPVCQLNDIQPATTADALAVCRRSLVGEGAFSANVPLSGRSPIPPKASSTPSTANPTASRRSSPTSTASVPPPPPSPWSS